MKQFIYPRFTLEEKLTEEQISFFEEQGFIHFEKFISKEKVQELIKAAQDVEDRWAADKREKVNGVPIKYGIDENGKTIVHRFAFLSLHSQAFHELLQDTRIPALFPLLQAPGRIGENEKDGLVLNHYLNTGTSNFTKMGWHTDCLRDVFYGKKIMPMLNVGIYLDDSSDDNGGLRVIPKSHKQNFVKLVFGKKYFVDNTPDENEVAINASAGDLTVHDGRMWHRVALSPHMGAKSRRRVMYVPVISGKYAPKSEESPTQLYQRFSKYVK
ncbi:MAG TPA: phytanoyl-CoA dioxygenase family protein [Bacteroidia bacterium]|nr:phytanoyl-CoA dioxygenase family protein [Bacteroidia bacterium]